eukprot:scaffold139809_cov58-Attheya_sp.AAC.4
MVRSTVVETVERTTVDDSLGTVAYSYVPVPYSEYLLTYYKLYWKSSVTYQVAYIIFLPPASVVPPAQKKYCLKDDAIHSHDSRHQLMIHSAIVAQRKARNPNE